MAISGGDGSIILTTKVDQSGLNNGIKTMKSGVNSLTSSFTKLGTALGISLGIGALVRFGKQAMKLASDLQEVQNVVDVAFGDMTYKMEKFAEIAIETYGISRLTAKQTGSSFMAMAKGMGVADEAASDMALTLTGLSADMASFYNISQEEARTALSAVYTGETETLKRYGVLITEVNLQEFARQKGITKSINKMTQQEKVLLRYNYVLEATSLAQGDFARTQDSFANKTRVLSEKWKEMQAVFGETLIILADSFLPILELIVEKITIFALYIAAFARGMRGSNAETQKATDQTKKLATQSNKTANSIKKTTNAIEHLGKETKQTNKQLAQFDDLMVLQTATSNDLDIGAGIGDINDILGVVSPNFSEELSALQGFLDSETIKKLQDFEKWVSDNKEGIKTALEIAGLGALGIGIANVAGKIGNLLGLFKKKDKGLDIQTNKTIRETQAVSSLASAFAFATGLGLGFVPTLISLNEKGVEFLPTLDGLKEKVYGLSHIFEGFKKTFDNFIPASRKAIEEIFGLSPALDKATQNSNILSPALEKITKKAHELFQPFKSAIGVVSEFGDTVGQKMPNIKNTIQGALENITQNIKVFASKTSANLANWGKNVQTNVINTSTVIATNIYSALKNAATNFNNFMSTSAFNVVNWAKNVGTNISETARTIATNWGNAISSAWENFKDFMSATGTKISKFWKKHKATIISTAVAVGIPAIAIALAPYTGGGSLAAVALAKGGIVPHATTALIGEKGKEAVLPLENNTEWMDILTDKILMRIANSGGGYSGNTEVILQIDGREFGRAVVEQGNKENRRIGTRLVIA